MNNKKKKKHISWELWCLWLREREKKRKERKKETLIPCYSPTFPATLKYKYP